MQLHAAQAVGMLHLPAATRVIRALLKNNVPSYIKCKGLLVKSKNQMTFYSISVAVGSLCTASLSIKYEKLYFCGITAFTLCHLCSVMKVLFGIMFLLCE